MSGSTIGGIVGGAIGFVVSGFNPMGAQIGFMAGSYIGSSFDKYHTPGPRLGDIPMQSSSEGVPRPIPFGTPQPFQGNIIQSGEPVRVIIKEEVDSGGKGGPTQTTDSEHVYQTVAIRVCEGEADLIRFWINGKLAYSTIAGDNIVADSTITSTKFRWYRGDDEQMPDPALQALPLERGGGTRTPAYRKTAYCVFDNFETTAYGGVFPQITWQVSTTATIEQNCTREGMVFWYPFDDVAPGGVCRELVAGKNGIYSGSVTNGGAISNGSAGSLTIDSDSDYMIVSETHSGFLPYSLHGVPFTVAVSIIRSSTAHAVANVVQALSNLGATPSAEWQFGFTSPPEYDTAYAGSAHTTQTYISDSGPSAGGRFVLTNDPTANGGLGESKFYLNGVLIGTGGGLSQQIASVFMVGEVPFPDSNGFRGRVADLQGFNYAWDAQEVLDDYVGVTVPIWEMPDAPGVFVDSQGNIVSGCQATATIGTETLDTVVTEIARRCGVDASQLDLTEDEDVVVRGLLIGRQMTGQSVIGTGAMAYFRDYIEADVGAGSVQLVSVPRGGSAAAELTSDDLLESDEDLINVGQGIEKPRRILLSYSSPASNYATRQQMAERESINVPATGDQPIEFPLVLEDNEAKQKAEIVQKVLNEESLGTYNFRLPFFKYAHLIPSDIVTLDGVRLRITKLEVLDSEMHIEAVRDRASNYISAAVGSTAIDPSAPVSSAKGPSILQALNLPRLVTEWNSPGMVLGVTGVTDAWPGADIYALFPGASTEVLVMTITTRATMGTLVDDITASEDPISLNVFNGRLLSSITAEQAAAGQNGIAITEAATSVSELKQFTTAVESADNVFEASDISHGLRGTVAASHTAGDQWLLIDNALRFLEIDASFIGQDITFRAVTRGTPKENNDTITVTFDPYFTGPATVDFLETINGVYAETIGGARIEAISE